PAVAIARLDPRFCSLPAIGLQRAPRLVHLPKTAFYGALGVQGRALGADFLPFTDARFFFATLSSAAPQMLSIADLYRMAARVPSLFRVAHRDRGFIRLGRRPAVVCSAFSWLVAPLQNEEHDTCLAA